MMIPVRLLKDTRFVRIKRGEKQSPSRVLPEKVGRQDIDTCNFEIIIQGQLAELL